MIFINDIDNVEKSKNVTVNLITNKGKKEAMLTFEKPQKRRTYRVSYKGDLFISPPQGFVPYSLQSSDQCGDGTLPAPSSWNPQWPICQSHKAGTPSPLPCKTLPWPALLPLPSPAPPTPHPNDSAPSSYFVRYPPVSVIERYGAAQIREYVHWPQGVQ